MWSAAVSLSRRRVRWKMKRIYAATNQHVIEISNPFTPSKTYHNFSLPPTASRCSLVVLHIHFAATAFRECWTLAGQYHNSMTIIFPLFCCCLFQSIWEEWERRKKSRRRRRRISGEVQRPECNLPTHTIAVPLTPHCIRVADTESKNCMCNCTYMKCTASLILCVSFPLSLSTPVAVSETALGSQHLCFFWTFVGSLDCWVILNIFSLFDSTRKIALSLLDWRAFRLVAHFIRPANYLTIIGKSRRVTTTWNFSLRRVPITSHSAGENMMQRSKHDGKRVTKKGGKRRHRKCSERFVSGRANFSLSLACLQHMCILIIFYMRSSSTSSSPCIWCC